MKKKSSSVQWRPSRITLLLLPLFLTGLAPAYAQEVKLSQQRLQQDTAALPTLTDKAAADKTAALRLLLTDSAIQTDAPRVAALDQAQLFLAYDLPLAAEPLLEGAVLRQQELSSAEQQRLDGLLLALAQQCYEHGLLAPAQRNLGRVGNRLPAALHNERLRLAMQLAVAQPDAAARVAGLQQLLEQIQHSPQPASNTANNTGNNAANNAPSHLASQAISQSISTAAQYNLALALMQSGEQVRAMQQLEMLAVTAPSITDEVNLTLGSSLLKQGQAEQASRFLQKVRLTSAQAPAALLALGWAYAQQQDFNAALNVWTELARRSTSLATNSAISPVPGEMTSAATGASTNAANNAATDAATNAGAASYPLGYRQLTSAEFAALEAMLAVPYAYAQLGANQQALRAYQQALALYQRQLAALTAAEQALQNSAVLDQWINSINQDQAVTPRPATAGSLRMQEVSQEVLRRAAAMEQTKQRGAPQVLQGVGRSLEAPLVKLLLANQQQLAYLQTQLETQRKALSAQPGLDDASLPLTGAQSNAAVNDQAPLGGEQAASAALLQQTNKQARVAELESLIRSLEESRQQQRLQLQAFLRDELVQRQQRLSGLSLQAHFSMAQLLDRLMPATLDVTALFGAASSTALSATTPGVRENSATASADKSPNAPLNATLASLLAQPPVLRVEEQQQFDPTLAITSVIRAYQQVLEQDALDASGKNFQYQALKRVADLQMQRAQLAAQAAQGTDVLPDYSAAVALYEQMLLRYPQGPANDQVLYQLAHAYEQAGQIEQALRALNWMLTSYPFTEHRQEVQFRRGEMLFALADYRAAEDAFDASVQTGRSSFFYERALYMHGWSLFKQGRMEESLTSFFRLLDLKLVQQGSAQDKEQSNRLDLSKLPGLARADLELIEDTFRVVSIALASVGDAQAHRVSTTTAALKSTTGKPTTGKPVIATVSELINNQITTTTRQQYEFRVYQQLAEFYFKQERVQDAVDTLDRFAQAQPGHSEVPSMQARAIEFYEQGGFTERAQQGKQQFIERYADGGEYQRRYPNHWPRSQPLVMEAMQQLARYHHARAQQGQGLAEFEQAQTWYRRLLRSYPQAASAMDNQFLLAELLLDRARYLAAAFKPVNKKTSRQLITRSPSVRPAVTDVLDAYAQAATEYEQSAYAMPHHSHSADAGYSALLAYHEQHALLSTEPVARQVADHVQAAEQATVTAALRFADSFPQDPRRAAVLTRAAEQLYALKDTERAAFTARQVTQDGSATPRQQQVAWTVLGHLAFERHAYAEAEQAYAQAREEQNAVLKETADNKAQIALPSTLQTALTERYATAIYKQGEQARQAGQLRDAVAHFMRTSDVAEAGSELKIAAQYDVATSLLALKEQSQAAQLLEDFRTRYPKHRLAAEVTPTLAATYLQTGRWSAAANEFERLSQTTASASALGADTSNRTKPIKQLKDVELQRSSLWQAAELYQKANDVGNAERVYRQYVQRYPAPLLLALQAQWQLAELAVARGDEQRAVALRRELMRAEKSAGASRTDQTRALAGRAALALAKPFVRDYQQVALVEPLKRQLKLKKDKLEAALKAYQAAASYEVADVVTAATYHTAELYRDFGRALMSSPKPRGLNSEELEQYAVLLEEQAFPFEEKAIELHEVNARRAAGGVYDDWVRNSYGVLAQLRPVRYGKQERHTGVINELR